MESFLPCLDPRLLLYSLVVKAIVKVAFRSNQQLIFFHGQVIGTWYFFQLFEHVLDWKVSHGTQTKEIWEVENERWKSETKLTINWEYIETAHNLNELNVELEVDLILVWEIQWTSTMNVLPSSFQNSSQLWKNDLQSYLQILLL